MAGRRPAPGWRVLGNTAESRDGINGGEGTHEVIDSLRRLIRDALLASEFKPIAEKLPPRVRRLHGRDLKVGLMQVGARVMVSPP